MTARLAGLVLVLAASAAHAQTPPMLDCTTTFGKAADEAALVKQFGRENVTSADIPGAEGSSERGTVLFAKDPARRIEILWYDTAKRRRPATIIVRARSGWAVRAPGSLGRTVAVRTTLDKVEEANERPFTLNGFAWDMGGYSAGWKGGKLGAIEGGCSLSVRFNPDPKIKGRALDKVSGEKQFGSSDPAIKAVNPTVSQLSVDWPE